MDWREIDVLDEDRTYLVAPQRLIKMEDDTDVLCFGLEPTNDPDKFQLTISMPAPRLFIKRSKIIQSCL